MDDLTHRWTNGQSDYSPYYRVHNKPLNMGDDRLKGKDREDTVENKKYKVNPTTKEYCINKPRNKKGYKANSVCTKED